MVTIIAGSYHQMVVYVSNSSRLSFFLLYNAGMPVVSPPINNGLTGLNITCCWWPQLTFIYYYILLQINNIII